MGQGLHTKMIQVASRTLDINPELIHINEVSTLKNNYYLICTLIYLYSISIFFGFDFKLGQAILGISLAALSKPVQSLKVWRGKKNHNLQNCSTFVETTNKRIDVWSRDFII